MPSKMATTQSGIVRPKDAASVIVHRTRDSEKQILLGRRHAKSTFMPNVFVFPGGRVDPSDAHIEPASNLDQRQVPFLAVGNQYARARTLAIAAVRETYEETGLMISRSGSVGNVQQENWRSFHQLGQAPDLAALKYVGRAITPTSEPIRFHARFFSCDADLLDHSASDVCGELSLASTNQIHGDGELNDIQWVSLNAIESLPIRSITRFMLSEHLALSEKPEGEQIGNAIYLHRGGKLHIQRQVSSEAIE